MLDACSHSPQEETDGLSRLLAVGAICSHFPLHDDDASANRVSLRKVLEEHWASWKRWNKVPRRLLPHPAAALPLHRLTPPPPYPTVLC